MTPPRDRDETGQFADGIDPETALDVFDARTDRARPLTAGDVADELGIARRTALNKLSDLVDADRIETRKVGAKGRVYWTPIPAVDESGPTSGHETAETPPADRRDTTVGDDAHGDVTADAADPIGDELIRWEPSTEADAKIARAQTRRAAEYLRDHAPERFKRSELVDALAGDSTLGDRHWWERAVRPGLRRLAETPLVEYRPGYHDYQWADAPPA